MIFIPLSFRVMSPLTQLTPRFQQGHVISIANQPSIGWPWSYRGQLWPLMVNRRVASYWRIFLWWIWGWFAWIYWWFMRIYMDSQICIYIYRYLFVILWLIYMDLLVIYIYIYLLVIYIHLWICWHPIPKTHPSMIWWTFLFEILLYKSLNHICKSYTRGSWWWDLGHLFLYFMRGDAVMVALPPIK